MNYRSFKEANALKVKALLRRSFEVAGIKVSKIVKHEQRPLLSVIPPHSRWSDIGASHNYFIQEGYQHRTEVSYFDDTGNTDGWQKEVYRFAREVYDRERLSSVCDLGCGSAFKLIKNFGDTSTVGLDVPATCSWLRQQYSDRDWQELDFNNPLSIRPDLVIASDVIEHLDDPDLLLNYVEAIAPKFIILSTPDRNLLNLGTHAGPPANPAHLREWSYAEFQAYVGNRFDILEHFISNASQATQCILCTLRPS